MQAADLTNWDGSSTSKSFRKLVSDLTSGLGLPKAREKEESPDKGGAVVASPTQLHSDGEPDLPKASSEVSPSDSSRSARDRRPQWSTIGLTTFLVALAVFIADFVIYVFAAMTI